MKPSPKDRAFSLYIAEIHAIIRKNRILSRGLGLQCHFYKREGIAMLDEKLLIPIGGIRQRIHIKTEDETKPVLLFLHGGPAICDRHYILKYHADLTDTFTLVCWDQRGSGGSYYGVKFKELTIERMRDDAKEIVEYLCKRFDKDKIFVIGFSWGSQLGTYLCQAYPERVAAFVGYGQVVDLVRNEELVYRFALEEATKANDAEALKVLAKVGPPVRGAFKGHLKGAEAVLRVVLKYGGYSPHVNSGGFAMYILRSGEYSLRDLWGIYRGYRRVTEALQKNSEPTNFPKSGSRFAMPFYIFHGRRDYYTPAALVEEWYPMIEAPDKCLVWFENSGHDPMSDEGDKFKPLLREKLRAVKERESARV